MRERLQFVRIIIGVYVSAEMERWQFVGVVPDLKRLKFVGIIIGMYDLKPKCNVGNLKE